MPAVDPSINVVIVPPVLLVFIVVALKRATFLSVAPPLKTKEEVAEPEGLFPAGDGILHQRKVAYVTPVISRVMHQYATNVPRRVIARCRGTKKHNVLARDGDSSKRFVVLRAEQDIAGLQRNRVHQVRR